MSKKCHKVTAKHTDDSAKPKEWEIIEKKQTCDSELDAVVGASNVSHWIHLRAAFSCKTNAEFATVLLGLAEQHLNRKSSNNEAGLEKTLLKQNEKIAPECSPAQSDNKISKNKAKKSPPKKVQTQIKTENARGLSNQEEVTNSFNVYDLTSLTNGETNKPCDTLSEKNNVLMQQLFSEVQSPVKDECESGEFISIQKENKIAKTRKNKNSSNNDKNMKVCKKSDIETKKKIDHDIRKAPELKVQVENKVQIQNSELNANEPEEVDKKRVAIKIKMCSLCNTHHLQDHCSLQNPQFRMFDSVTFLEWQKCYKPLYEERCYTDSFSGGEFQESEKGDLNIKFSFASMSIPSQLCLKETSNGLCVFTKGEIKSHTQFGPLIGKTVREVDIPEESNMKDYWEVQSEKFHGFISTESVEESNWMRFVRPAPTRDERNVTAVCRNEELYFVAIKNLQEGEEMLYWQDSNVTSNKKKLEKTICGGCNMTFAHPLHYRMHCSVFHDMRYSLTIRKYHCKVCGVAVLGKENIMKHAAELHNGQGAYQCQFCKKFFLRLNYLEMHRTYGCSANPHRSRPLCDFCGRKFCQPQKLKVHIKRMHSDMSEVLKEFQCKNCLKILGSRAALQRHLKEVHQKQVEGACTCVRCGKLFQNKSNLKIHMLTHSGIKPFKCIEKDCNAAFTTKQCLQFHYKKVHGFTENEMPKIERSVDYTFEAYSGLEDGEMPDKSSKTSDMSVQSNEECSDVDSTTGTDDKNPDDPPPLRSPNSIGNGLSSNSNASPPVLEPYTSTVTLESNTKLLTKGSKKWIGDQVFPVQNQVVRVEDTSNSMEVEESHNYEAAKLGTGFGAFNRHESNASLLVEAALDSVCSESNIDMDVTTVPNSTDTLVNNLYTLAHPDTLPDVNYNNSMNESRDINLISPSVNDHISVTDDLNDDLRQNQNINNDYSAFHQEEFSPAPSPNIQHKNNFVGDYMSTVSPDGIENYETDRSKNVSPISSPPRYDFNQPTNVEHNLSSDDSNGIGVQNLSLHNTKNDMQLDLSIYKSPYFRMKFDSENERKQVYVLEVGDDGKNYNAAEENLMPQPDLGNLGEDSKQKEPNIERYKYSIGDQTADMRNKFELDLDLRIKSYENLENELRSRNYEGCDPNDFRLKNYEVDGMDSRNKPYEGLVETDFRTERSLEPLLLNPTDIQGLDMSARSYHNYSNLNRYHHLYPEIERPNVDLRLNYSPPQPSYTHADILRVVSLDLTPPGRHSVDLSIRTHSLHQIANSRLLSEHALQSGSHRLLDQSRLLNSDLNGGRHLGETRILSDHTTNRLLSNDQMLTNRLMPEDTRLIPEQPRLLEQTRLLGDGRLGSGGTVSPAPVQYGGYSVSPSPYHPTPLPPRPHATSPTPSGYHHYSAYY